MPLDPMALRKPEFRGGAPIILADGQEWFLPCPAPLWIADDSEEGARYGFDLGPEYDVLSQAFDDATTVGEVARAVLKAAKYLLRLNYEIGADRVGELLQANFTRPAEGQLETDANRLARELSELVAGVSPAPKHLAVGDA